MFVVEMVVLKNRIGREVAMLFKVGTRSVRYRFWKKEILAWYLVRELLFKWEKGNLFFVV